MDVKTAKHTVSIDPFIARIDWYEAPTLEELTEALQSIVDHPQYRDDLCLLAVDHWTGFDQTEEQIRKGFIRLEPLIRKFKACAFADTKDDHYEVARFFSAQALRAGLVIGAFKDEVAAGVWLMGAS